MIKERKAGILFPLASLPSRHGVGDFGRGAYEFADALKEGGYAYWQVLPLNPLGYGHSPYQPFSSYAIEECYCDLDDLYKRGLLRKKPGDYMKDAPKVYYEEIRSYKFPYLQEAYEKEVSRRGYRFLYAFMKKHPFSRDYGYFMANKRHNDLRSWSTWSEEEKSMGVDRPRVHGEYRKAYYFEIWLQYTLYRQFDALHRYLRKLGIRLIGDVPFYVGYDSCDVYGHRDLFLLDEVSLEPTYIAGVPPDYFSATGQRWGNPIYDWKKLQDTDFAFLNERLSRNASLYDLIRLDHFRAFDTYWKIPATCPTAIEGKWIEAPGYAFFDQLLKKYPDIDIIAEDLGDLRPEVLVLRDHYDFPGMNVVEFTFDTYMDEPSKWEDRPNMVAYIGTHDNDTAKGYFEAMEPERQKKWTEKLNELGFKGKPSEMLIGFLLSLKAGLAVISLSDLLDKGSEARINVPGVIDDVNFTYREADMKPLRKAILGSKKLLGKYGRL